MSISPGTVTLRILNEVHVKFNGLRGEHLELLYEKYGILTEGYFFSPQFQLGRWDGKKRFFFKNGQTYLFLIEEILPIIKSLGYKIKIDDVRQYDSYQPSFIDETLLSRYLHPKTKQPIILNEHQVEGVNALIEHGFGVCVAATAAGKTIMCAALLTAYDKPEINIKSITIVPSGSLITQTKTDYINCDLDTGEYSGKIKDLNHKHIVSTWQALQNNPTIIQQFNMVIVDECHGLKGNKLQDIVCDYASQIPYRFGFTGTIPKNKTEEMMVHIAVGPKRYEILAHELMNRGILSTISIDIIQLEEDFSNEYEEYRQGVVFEKPKTYTKFKDEYFGDYEAEKSYLKYNKTRLDWIVDLIEEKRCLTKGNLLCLVDEVALSRKLTSLIPRAICVNGTDMPDLKKRQLVYDMFEDHNDLVVIATAQVAGTGISIDRIFHMVTIDIGKSFIRVIQGIGRGLRKNRSDKFHLNFTDVCSDLKYGKKHLKDRIDYYNEAKYQYKKRVIKYSEHMNKETEC